MVREEKKNNDKQTGSEPRVFHTTVPGRLSMGKCADGPPGTVWICDAGLAFDVCVSI